MISAEDPSGSRSGMTGDRMNLFLAGLAGLPAEEVSKAKQLFLRNEIAQYKAICAENAAQKIGMLMMYIIPLAWPAAYSLRRTMKARAQLQEDRIRNALAVWGQDLGPEASSLRAELDAAVAA